MTDSITRRQNTDQQLRRLVAQRRLYSRAKQIPSWQVIVTVVLVMVWALVVLALPSLKVYAAVWGLLAVALDFAIFAPRQSSLKATAASIQELFDCDVLALPWQEIKAGSPPDVETVAEWSRLKPEQSYDGMQLRNWYPLEAGEAPLPIGRVICQRANCWWDAKLRRRYAVWVVVSTAGTFVFTALVGLLGRVSLEQFLLAGCVGWLIGSSNVWDAPKSNPISENSLDLQRCLAEWRSSHAPRSPLPDDVWSAAVELARKRGLHRTACTLPIDYANLRMRLSETSQPPRLCSIQPARRAGKLN